MFITPVNLRALAGRLIGSSCSAEKSKKTPFVGAMCCWEAKPTINERFALRGEPPLQFSFFKR